jgi:hypothetical protein
MNQVVLLHDIARPYTSLNTKGGNCNNEADCSPSYSLQSRFSTLRLPHFWSPEGCTLRTLFCGRRRAEIQRALGAPTLQQRILCYRHTAFHARLEMSKLIMKKTLCKNNLNFLNCVHIMYTSCTPISL